MTKPGELDWTAILAEHNRWIRTVVYSRLREPDAVEDVMQEIAFAAVRQSAPLSDSTKVAPWLYRLAIRQVLLHRRKMGRRRKLIDRYKARLPADDLSAEHEPLQWLLAKERGELLRRAIDDLPERDAEVLMLKYTEDWSYDRIADQLGISHSAVEARLHRARRRLRDTLTASRIVEVER